MISYHIISSAGNHFLPNGGEWSNPLHHLRPSSYGDRRHDHHQCIAAVDGVVVGDEVVVGAFDIPSVVGAPLLSGESSSA